MILPGLLAWLMFPAFLAAVAVSAAGIIRGRPMWLLTGALLSVPFSYLYLHQTPRFEWVGLLPMACHLGATLALRWRARWAAWLLLAPIAWFLGWLAWTVTSEGSAPLPSGPEVKVGDVAIPVVSSSHCWSGDSGRSSGFASGMAAPEVIRAKALAPVSVPAGARVDIRFPVAPDFVSIHQWLEGRPHRLRLGRDGSLQVPGEPGLYTFQLAARWRQGGASWVIYLEVRSP